MAAKLKSAGLGSLTLSSSDSSEIHTGIASIKALSSTALSKIQRIDNHNTKKIIKSKKYYAYGQYSRYIRPGYTLIGSSDNSTAAYDTKSKTAVIVVTNTKNSNKKCQIDLSKFSSVAQNSSVKVIRTSGTLAKGENWKDVSKSSSTTLNRSGKKLNTVLKKNSITTYVITNVNLPKKRASKAWKKISLHQNQITAKKSSDGSDLPGNMVDQDYDTEYGCKQGNAIVDLGKKYKINAIAFAASSLNASYTQDIQIYGSNNQKKWTKLFTVTAQPSSMTLNYVNRSAFATGKRQFRYLKFRKKSGRAALSELRVFGKSVASEIATKFPKQIKSSKKLPKKIRLKNGKSAKVSYYTIYRGTNDNMTKKQRRTVQLKAHLKKSLPGYGKTVIQNATMSPSLYKKWKGSKIR